MTAERVQGPARVPSVDELLSSPRLARALAPEAARDLYVSLAPVLAELQIAACAPAAELPAVSGEARVPHLLTVAEVAERARKSARWVRDHWRRELPFGVRKGRTVLFPEAQVERWLNRP
jgi:hypothetical protein